jgi:ribosomal protein S18 acetylase RimI-like enzyme
VVVKVRPAQASDAAAVVALWTQGYSSQGPEGRVAPYEEAEFFASARSGEPFVAEEGGEVVGIVVFYPPGAPDGPTGLAGEAGLTRLVVAEAARGRGVGRALALLCEERAREEGAVAIALWSRPYQAGAHRLYASLGYRRAPERDGSDPEGGRWVFLRELGARG